MQSRWSKNLPDQSFRLLRLLTLGTVQIPKEPSLADTIAFKNL